VIQKDEIANKEIKGKHNHWALRGKEKKKGKNIFNQIEN
jgi:hypothetical protein